MKRDLLMAVAVAGLGLSAFAQKNPTAEKFASYISPVRAKEHLSILASDEFEGRETGKKGLWMAADYIKKQFQSFGLVGPVKDAKDPYLQQIGFYSKGLDKAMLSVNGQEKTFAKDFYILAPSIAETFNLTANEVIFAGFGINKDGFNEYEGLDVKGKIVMIFATGDPTAKSQPQSGNGRRMGADTRAKIAYLNQQGAAGVLLINQMLDNPPAQLADYLKRRSEGIELESATKAKLIPQVYIGSAVANAILAPANTTLADAKKKIEDSQKPASITVKTPVALGATLDAQYPRAENVLGFLEGSDPKLKNEVLVITGHYDHIGLNPDPNATDKVFNGADDDGSGTTGVLLMAEAFSKAKKAGKGPKRSILFMTVCGEEKGLLGSEWYSEHPVFPLENTIADLNTDMIGRIGEQYLGKPDSANYIYSVGSAMLSSDLAKIQEEMNNTYTKMKLDFKYDDPNDTERIYYRSDHYNFAKHNIPIIFYYDGMLGKDYHGLGDEVSKINFDLLAKRAHLTYYIGWELANRANRPVVDKDGKGNLKK